MKKIRVLIVEDSRVIQEFLQHIINQDPRLEVAGVVSSAEQALRLLHRLSPDVISMDIRLPGMDGFEATRRIMTEKPTPIVVVSANVESDELKISMNALRAGALSIVEKPVGMSHDDYEFMAERLCTQLAIMSQVKLVRQRLPRGLVGVTERSSPQKGEPKKPVASDNTYGILGVVASTGGPNALVKLFEGLTQDFPLPILLVQHISERFLEGFVAWLNDACPLNVKIAKHREQPLAGTIFMAPPDRHLQIERGRLRVTDEDPVSAQRPSGTLLFQSMARDLGTRAIGVLLTGMGDDGADGLNKIHQAGGFTIAEDESTAVVFGMPAVACRMGAVTEALPLPDIAPRILQFISAKPEVTR